MPASPLRTELSAPPDTVDAVAVCQEDDAADWQAFIAGRGHAASYHAWAWRRVFANTFGHRNLYLAARSHGRMVGVLPLVLIKSAIFGRSLTSLPFLNYGGMIAETAAAQTALLTAARDLARDERCGYVELRHIARQAPELPVRQHKVTMLLDLQQAGWDALDRKVRNQIRKAQKSALTVTTGGVEQLGSFYRVFSRNMRDLGTPVYPVRLFREVLAAFPDSTRLHVVNLAGAPIAAGFTYWTGDTVQVPWASSIVDYNSLCPNHLLYWSIIEAAVGDGRAVLDFGRSTPNEGTFKFKEQWGARPVALNWEYLLLDGALPNVTPANPKFRLAVEAWRRLPLSVATTLGPHVVRGIP